MPAKALTGASAQTIVLTILDDGETYGYHIIHRVEQLSDGQVVWSPGSLYPLLHRMKADGLVTSRWVQPEGSRRRRYYAITSKGRRKMETERKEWLSVHRILARLWGLQPGGSRGSALPA